MRLRSCGKVYGRLFYTALITLSLGAGVCFAQSYSLGTGIYPGNPDENFAPSIKIDSISYKNIALLRPVYGSGSYDFCLTPQLLTDGIIENEMPGWILSSSSSEKYQRTDREKMIDRNVSTRKGFISRGFRVQIEMAGNYDLPEVNGFKFNGSVSTDTAIAEIKPYTVKAFGSNDGNDWVEVGALTKNKLIGDTLKGYRRKIYPQNYRVFDESLQMGKTVKYKMYKVEFYSENIFSWRLGDCLPSYNGEPCFIGGPYKFSSSWKSSGSGSEWVYIDLGNICSFNRINLYWLRRAESGSVLISDDAKTWKEISKLQRGSSSKDEIVFNENIKARFVRFNFDKAVSLEEGYILSEIEIYGTGAPYAEPHPQAKPGKDGSVILSGGNWKLQRTSLIKEGMEKISKTGYDDKSWIIATVPGTVLVSYLNNGMIPDPNFGDNQFLISDSYFYSDFIYRDEFKLPESYKNKKVFLNLDGINWKAEVYVNGNRAGRVEGAFARGKFDVTELVLPGAQNAVAVYIYKNYAPGFVKEPTLRDHQANGGELGLDNPTFHTSVGWDWFPSVRGRNTGIWNEIYFTTSGAVTIEDPFVSSKLPLPDTSSADIKIQVTLCSHSNKNINGKLKGKFGPAQFEVPVSLAPSETKTVTLNSEAVAALHIKNPRLWWPNGYGEQNLYDVNLQFITGDGKISDEKTLKAGVRQMSYSEKDSALKIWINGRRFIPRGGNWGFSESNLRYRGREYDIAVRYHKEMNLNMLRNWVGQTGDDEFFEACDKYGIMVWQDFWLANPGDGPNPKDNKLFMQNAEDFVKNIRNHPSIGLYCGRNEGYPPEELEKSLRSLLPKIAPDIHYIASSADDIVSGHGPYAAKPLKYYFKDRATPKFHSEIGLPSPVSYESLKMMMPDTSLWPVNRMWGIHDFSMESAQEGENFMAMMDSGFGKIDNVKDWLKYAQWISYQGYRAIYEAQGKNRMGALIWMTHCAWPSFVFQTYDYYFEPTGAYFGCKKGSEPLHIQWNAFTDSIEIVNYSVPDGKNLKASVELINTDGTVKLKKEFQAGCPADGIIRIYKLEQPAGLSNTYFIRLKLEKEGKPVSENFYWNGLKEENYSDIAALPKASIEMKTNSVQENGKWFIAAELTNNSKAPALMVKLKVTAEKTKERILPVIFSDNFVSIMPGEKKTVNIEVNGFDAKGEKPEIEIEGINIK